MWVYAKPVDEMENGWEVGYFQPDGAWHGVRTYATEAAAAKRVHYLNGGNYEREDET